MTALRRDGRRQRDARRSSQGRRQSWNAPFRAPAQATASWSDEFRDLRTLQRVCPSQNGTGAAAERSRSRRRPPGPPVPKRDGRGSEAITVSAPSAGSARPKTGRARQRSDHGLGAVRRVRPSQNGTGAAAKRSRSRRRPPLRSIRRRCSLHLPHRVSVVVTTRQLPAGASVSTLLRCCTASLSDRPDSGAAERRMEQRVGRGDAVQVPSHLVSDKGRI
jgi:hypothetical protein